MTTDHNNASETERTDLTQETALDLLNLSLETADRPADSVARRIDSAEGEAWLDSVLSSAMVHDVGLSPPSVLRADTPLDSLTALKNAAKSHADHADADTTAFVYFLAVAAALVHCETLISSRKPAEVQTALITIAGAMPDQAWRNLFSDAAAAVDRWV